MKRLLLQLRDLTREKTAQGGPCKTSDVAPTTKLEGSMFNCTQQSADGEVVVVRGQSIHERTESNAKGQIAKGNVMVSFKIGAQVLYSLSHGSNRKDSKQYMVLL